MRYEERKGGSRVFRVSAAELCSGAPSAASEAAAAEYRSIDGRVQTGRTLRADFVCENVAFEVEASPAGFIPDEAGGCVIIDFRRPGRDRISLYAQICAAVAFRAGCGKPTVRQIQVFPDGTLYESRDTAVDAERAVTKAEGLLTPFVSLASFEKKRAEELLPALGALKFPYPSLREGQRELIERVYSSVRRRSRLFVSAPTGIGKTVSVLYGALRAMAGGEFRRIFYLTAKQSTRKEAFAAVSLLSPSLPGLHAAVLAPKDQMCPYGIADCDRERCPLASGKAESASAALLKRELASHRGFPAGHIKKTALECGVCPYYYSINLAEYCDVVICDYNSAFDPAARLKRLFEWSDPSDSILLVDEAHNLPGRARESFSAEISSSDLIPLIPFAETDARLCDAIDALAIAFEKCAALCDENAVTDEDGRKSGWYYSASLPEAGGLCDAVRLLDEVLKGFSAAHRNDAEILSAISRPAAKISGWRDASGYYNSRYRTYIKLDRDVLSVRLFCLDPSERLDAVLSAAGASVFFSATLTPSDYYADILGGGSGCEKVELPSPYPPENLFVGIYAAADTRYEARDATSKRVCAAIAATVAAKRGNYMVFFPSYGYLERVSKIFIEKYPQVRVAVQSRGMKASEKSAFLDFFSHEEGVLKIGFCVLGGSFSEGIDLPGDRLIGTVIVGVGLPGLSEEGNIIRDYYESRSGCGYDYAYVYPGMNAVLQAAGRVIRSDTDRGAVILVDDRYDTEKYRAMMPEHWNPQKFNDPVSLKDALVSFWKQS